MTDLLTSTARRIAFAGYKNMNLGAARHFAALGIGENEFFEWPVAKLAAITGLKSSYFDDAKRAEAIQKGTTEAQFAINNGIKTLFFADDNYPSRMNDCDDAPALLFCLGEAQEAAHAVSIVGTRHSTAYGLDFTRHLVEDLAASLDSLLIVSGLAYGIDIAAHRAALSAGVPTGAVLAHGLNTIYPADHRNEARRMVKEGGFLMTEYPSYAPIHKGNFLARNRIVAAMADVTVVVESDNKGGAMSTARIAGAYNREVMALPGRITDTYSRGCNSLISRGEAIMVRDAGDIIDALGWKARPVEKKQQELPFLSPEQTQIADFLKSKPDATVNDLCSGIGIPYSRLSALLFEMEMDDIVTALPGGRYCLVNPDV